MLIQKVDRTREAFNDYSLEGTVLTIGEIAVDLEAEQGDQEVIIPFSEHNGKIHRGMMSCCTYVAEVIIPPRQYLSVETEGPPSSFTGDGEAPETHMETAPVLLDVDSVILKLWPVENSRQEEISMAGGEVNAD